MRRPQSLLTTMLAPCLALGCAYGDEQIRPDEDAGSSSATTLDGGTTLGDGDGDGDGAGDGDGDGDPGAGDGDGDGGPGTGDGDGDGDPGTGDGDGDGDPGTGDGDGDGDGDAGTGDGDGDGDPGSGDGDGDGDGDPIEACYLGLDSTYTTCRPVAPLDPTPADYVYPAPYLGQDNYREPIRFLDLDAIDPTLMLAPNFRIDELAQSAKGQFAVISPGAVERLQDMRDVAGAIQVTSGYRSPGYNAGIAGSASSSRHLYGDGFDLVPLATTLASLETICENNGGFLVQYTSHVHCDWRNDLVDEVFFGAPGAAVDPGQWWFAGSYGAAVERDDATGRWTAQVQGFHEGTPVVTWAAVDREGRVLTTQRTNTFEAPRGTAFVEAIIGGRVHVEVDARLR